MRTTVMIAALLAVALRAGAATRWQDPLALPAAPSSAQEKAVSERARAAAKDLPAGIRKSVEASRAKIEHNLLAERHEALHQLGIPERGTGYLTILVSSSMPQGMLNGYAQSAVWAGGVIAFRGVNPKHDIGWFIKHVMHRLVRPGASPSITLDPRAFSAWGVTSVPAIVYSTQSPGHLCDKQVIKTIRRPKKPPLKVHDCAPADPASYWKITGAVSVVYALRQFVAAGAPGARRLLRAVRADPLSSATTSGGAEAKLSAKLSARKPMSLDAAAYAKAQGPGSLADVLRLMNAPTRLPNGQ